MHPSVRYIGIIIAFISIVVQQQQQQQQQNVSNYGCDAKKIDSYDLLIGHWDTIIRIPKEQFENVIESDKQHNDHNHHKQQQRQIRQNHQRTLKLFDVFAPTTTDTSRSIHHSPLIPSSSSLALQQQQRNRIQHFLSNTFVRHVKYPCRLSIYPNQTFELISSSLQSSTSQSSSVSILHNINNNNLHNNNIVHQPSHSPFPSIRIHGQWKIQINPYCVTDRFYDIIQFKSIPRIQKCKQYIISNSNNSSNEMIASSLLLLQKVQLQFNCRLYGHFSSGRRHYNRLRFFRNQQQQQHAFARGKLTHGIMKMNTIDLLQNSNNNNNVSTATVPVVSVSSSRTFTNTFPTIISTWLQQQLYNHHPKIIASFTAKRYITSINDLSSPSDTYNNDQEEFGY